MRYAHLAPENVRAAVAALEGDVSRSGFTLRMKEGAKRTKCLKTLVGDAGFEAATPAV